jgi:hypothetical protein
MDPRSTPHWIKASAASIISGVGSESSKIRTRNVNELPGTEFSQEAYVPSLWPGTEKYSRLLA